MQIKKIFNLEEVLTSDEFIAQKQDEITAQYQRKYSGLLVKVYTYCKEDRKIVISTSEASKLFIGATDKTLAHRLIDEQSLLSLDNEMTDTYELIITTDTALPDYVTAIDVAQAKADEKFDSNKSLLPIITVVDYRWGNPVTLVLPTVFSDGITPVRVPSPSVSIGDPINGHAVIDSNNFDIELTNLEGLTQYIVSDYLATQGYILELDYTVINANAQYNYVFSSHIGGHARKRNYLNDVNFGFGGYEPTTFDITVSNERYKIKHVYTPNFDGLENHKSEVYLNDVLVQTKIDNFSTKNTDGVPYSQSLYVFNSMIVNAHSIKFKTL